MEGGAWREEGGGWSLERVHRARARAGGQGWGSGLRPGLRSGLRRGRGLELRGLVGAGELRGRGGGGGGA